MLYSEKTFPEKLAYDCITKQVKNFLYRHYNLDNIIPQTNKFTVFREFFIQNQIFFKPKEHSNKYNNNIQNGDTELNRKIANMGRELVYTIKPNKYLDIENKGTFNNNRIPAYNYNMINRVNSSEKIKEICSNNQELNPLSKSVNKTSDLMIPKSSDFSQRKNFALYYLNDLSKPVNIPPVRGQRLINDNYQSYPSYSIPVSPHENFFYEKFSHHQKEIEKTKERIMNLENRLCPKNSQLYSYNKRNEYATLWDQSSKKPNILSYLDRNEGLYNRNVEIHPIKPSYK